MPTPPDTEAVAEAVFVALADPSRRAADEQAYRVLHRQSLQFTGC